MSPEVDVRAAGISIALAALSCAAPRAAVRDPVPAPLADLVERVRRADYEGDRAALRRLHEELGRHGGDEQVAARVWYWRGFALWRRAINGFNDSVDAAEQERDLSQATADFERAAAKEPAFVDAKVAAVGSLGLIAFLHRDDPARLTELRPRFEPLLREVQADPNNPRLLWVTGPMRWNTPPEKGGGQDKAIEGYEKGLAVARQRKERAAPSPLEPSWGEPELLMSLAWSHLNRTVPDLEAAERNARAALTLVPHWHYVRDILLPQILKAKAEAAQQSAPK